ncbi:MAG: VOC family protein [Alphaproteobacteria bacterium]
MPLSLTKDSIDLGIITTDADAMLAFYQGVLGFELHSKAERPGSTMYRLACGTSLIKIVQLDDAPPARAPKGGLQGATGYRYWTISCDNVDEMAGACEAAGYKVPMPPFDIEPGLRITMVEDPDGNWVEFIQRDT